MQKQKGITLISLIITIILLMILVRASLGIVLQDDFFNKARKTAETTEEKISNQDKTIENGQNDWEKMEIDICSHIWGAEKITLESTCTTSGKKEKKCENCGKTIETEIPAPGHSYGEWVTTVSLTCTTNGERKRTCTVCGAVETEIITKTGHNYENGKCTICGEELVIGANIDYHEYLSETGSTVSSSYTSTKTTRGSTDSSDADATYSVVNNSGDSIRWRKWTNKNNHKKHSATNEWRVYKW